MNTIEQAAQRLAQLRQIGALAPTAPQAAPVTVDPPSPWSAKHVAPVGAGPQSQSMDIDLKRLARSGLLVPGAPRSQLEDEFRVIKRPLLDNAKAAPPLRPHRANLIMVTSAVAGEGKTHTAINLAVSMAMEMDHSVLLVEADVVRPTTLQRLGLEAQHGLIDLLDGSERLLSQVLIRTNIPKLTLLPCGTLTSRSTELLASARMAQLLDELANKYADRIIVFDAPPLLPSTEARVMASGMGQILMVVESDKTPADTIKQAFDTVKDHPLVLSVLNKHQGPKGQRYGYDTY